MSRYIDAEKIEKYMQQRIVDGKKRMKKRGNIYIAECYSLEQFKEYIEDQPTADVEEVGHEEWYPDGCCRKCSRCGFLVKNTAFEEIEFYNQGYHYCPNCGAKMDK